MSDSAAVDHWAAVSAELTTLQEILTHPKEPRRLYAFADHVVALIRAYHTALKAEGKTSIRIQAAERALDLKTDKSAIQAFLGET
ncbi:MAG: hypothetical protein H7Z43_12925 [Clostridia bacterium]|nr:hypothetical protein [Deltaproteobacteria bacterium]